MAKSSDDGQPNILKLPRPKTQLERLQKSFDSQGLSDDSMKLVGAETRGSTAVLTFDMDPEVVARLEKLASVQLHDPGHTSGRSYLILDNGVKVEFERLVEGSQPASPGKSITTVQKVDRLTEPSAAEQREVMDRWQQTVSGVNGERITRLDKPDDPIAYKLLDAAGEAIARRQVQAGIDILQLVVKDFGKSQEAALARQALDQIKKQASRSR